MKNKEKDELKGGEKEDLNNKNSIKNKEKKVMPSRRRVTFRARGRRVSFLARRRRTSSRRIRR